MQYFIIRWLLIILIGLTPLVASSDCPEPTDIAGLKSGQMTLRVGRYVSPPPLYYPASLSKQGLITEIFDAVAQRAGIRKVRYFDFDSVDDLKSAFNQGRIDVISNAWDTPFNQQRYLLTKPFSKHGGVAFIYLKEKGSFRTTDDLRDHTLGTLRNNFFQNYCYSSIKLPKKSVKIYPSFTELMTALNQEKVDVALAFLSFARYEQKRDKNRYQVTPVQIFKNVFAVSQQDTDLQKLLNEAIDGLEREGTLYKIKNKYLRAEEM